MDEPTRTDPGHATPLDERVRLERVAERLGVCLVRRSSDSWRWGWYDQLNDGNGGRGYASEEEALRAGIEAAAEGRAYCARCGCTDDDPCEGGCHWVAPDVSGEMADVCSACVEA